MQTHHQKRFLLGLMAVGMLAGALSVAGSTHAASGNGPYYAEPAWDQKLAPATRFVVLTDWASQAVLDRETGLVWEQSPTKTTHEWADARFQCPGHATGGRKGWRLPSVHELASLVDPSVQPTGPTLPAGHPFTNVLSTFYWSATTVAGDLASAWDVDLDVGLVGPGNKTNTAQIWCVRGGMNSDQY